MAKDRTNRGGRRIRAGTKPDSLAEKMQIKFLKKRGYCLKSESVKVL